MPSGTDSFDSNLIKVRKVRRIFPRLLTAFAAAFAAFALYFYCSERVFRVEVSNQSGAPLVNVQITMPARYPLPDWTVWKGTLKPGESHALYTSTAGHGTLKVSYAAGGQSFEGGDYVSDWLAQNEYFTVRPSGKIQVESDQRYRLFWLMPRNK